MPRSLFVVLALTIGSIASSCRPGYVQVGTTYAPDCPYGYYAAAPYDCAPFGYYGPEWFAGGEFIGAGPWFHGDRRFRGNVDNHFHPDHGYRGPMPQRGQRAVRRVNASSFHGNETRDGRGHVVGSRRH